MASEGIPLIDNFEQWRRHIAEAKFSNARLAESASKLLSQSEPYIEMTDVIQNALHNARSAMREHFNRPDDSSGAFALAALNELDSTLDYARPNTYATSMMCDWFPKLRR
jgi:hypothetical protein